MSNAKKSPDDGGGWTPIAEEAERAPGCCTRMLQLPRPTHRRVMTIANQKGGVGKTTTAVNIAAALALHGLRVLVIDLDPQGNASTALGIEHRLGTPSVYEVLIGETSLADAAQVSDQSPNLYCVPATIDLAGAEIELVSMNARESRLKEALSDEALDQLSRLRADRLPALARPAHRQRDGGRRRGASSPSSASTTRWRGSVSCSATSSSCRTT